MPPHPGARRFLPTLSLRGRLAVLAATTVLPLLAFGLTEAYLRYSAEREIFAERTIQFARGLARAVDADHKVRIAGLESLALSPALRTGDLEAFRPVAEDYIQTLPRGSTLGLADQSGQLLLAVGDVPRGVALPKRRNMTAQDQVFRTGRPTVSNLFTNAITHRHTYTVEVPVLREGQVVYDFGLDPTPASLTELIAQQRLPEGWVASIIDANGIVVARKPNPDKFVGQPTSPALRPLVMARPEGVVETVSLDGTPLLTAFSHADPSGWSVAVGVPRVLVLAPLRQRIFSVLGISALLLLASLLAATWLARRITVPIAGLARFAAAAGQRNGLLPALHPTGLREVDEVGRTLASTTAALRELADTLEHRVESEVAERTRTEDALRQSQKMELVGQLTAGLAHDFNNLLQAQMSGLELLLKSIRGQERPTRYAQMALASSEKAARLTHSLLSFSRKQMLRPEPVDTQALLQRLETLLSRTLDPRITLRTAVRAELPPPLADVAQLEAALLNLCVNGRDAMAGSGGELLVEARSGATSLSGLRLPDGLEPERCVVFTVTDEGAGMDPATLTRVCEPFFTTKGIGKGSGLGLSMVQGFARQSGGKLVIESWPGIGTRVAIWLPMAAMTGALGGGQRDDAAYQHADRNDQGAGRVLLVDDEPSPREAIAEALKGAGFDVTQAGNADDALAMLRAPGARFDVLVTDYAMPGITGGELIAAARRDRPHLPALVITGYVEFSQLGQVPNGCKVLHKPFRTDDLVAHLAKLIEPVEASAG